MIGFLIRLAINSLAILIVTHIVRGIEVTSTVGHGTEFRVTLPRDPHGRGGPAGQRGAEQEALGAVGEAGGSPRRGARLT